MKYSKEKEREYYNQKIIKDGIVNGVTQLGDDVDNENYKFPWKNFAINCIGTIFGMIVSDMIGTEAFISNKGLRLCADVLIIMITISLVNLIFMGISKLSKPKAN